MFAKAFLSEPAFAEFPHVTLFILDSEGVDCVRLAPILGQSFKVVALGVPNELPGRNQQCEFVPIIEYIFDLLEIW